MIVMESRPELNVVHSRGEAELHLERTEIRFHDVDENRVRIELTVHNNGAHRSPPTLIRIESAPFGAFVPWTPLTQIRVPALEPGESRELSTEASRAHPAPLGDFNRVPPRRLLTAVASDDQPSPVGGGVVAFIELLRRRQAPRVASTGAAGKGFLAPDLWEWVGREQTHWAGNINVFVNRQPVERHMAKALRVYPGRTNMAMFIVGPPRRPDAFAFELRGLETDWKACLYDVTSNRTLVVDSADAPIEEERWVETNGALMVVLATRPPADCSTGNLQVHVTQRSSQKAAVVEFDLDPKAQGPGCYAM
jgi:hypothetical protein